MPRAIAPRAGIARLRRSVVVGVRQRYARLRGARNSYHFACCALARGVALLRLARMAEWRRRIGRKAASSVMALKSGSGISVALGEMAWLTAANVVMAEKRRNLP
jgi:hypothetical protein